MTYVVLESCIRCKLTDCVEVCPVDCFHEGPNFLVIDPEECIDCSLCEPECPVDAIVAEDDLPADQQEFLELNRELSLSWPVITEMKDPPPDADDWREVKEKRQYLERCRGSSHGGGDRDKLASRWTSRRSDLISEIHVLKGQSDFPLVEQRNDRL